MRVLVAMSGGVDSSVAAALLVEQGQDVVGATLKLWGGASDSGCCSVGDVEDARRVASQLGIDHHVFNMTAAFEISVVQPYVAAHARGRTPNPCIECNRHIKFDALLSKARRLGFDAVATGHHARVVAVPCRARGGAPGRAPGASADRSGAPQRRYRLLRGADASKDQSYVLSVLGQRALAALLLPIGELTKHEVRQHAARLRLRTATKPDSQDVCFIRSDEGRRGFLAERLTLHPASVVQEPGGRAVGAVDAVELVTVGQRRGMGHDERGQRRYVTRLDVTGRVVAVGTAAEAARSEVSLERRSLTWVADPLPSGSAVLAQLSAHGQPARGTLDLEACSARVRFDASQRPVAPGQTVALYSVEQPAEVLGAALAA